MKAGLFITCLFITAAVFAQSKNFVVTDNGDSLYGKISLKNKIFTVNGNSEKKEISADHVRWIYAENFKGNTVVHCRLYVYNDDLGEMDIDYASTKDVDTVLVLKEIYTTPKMNLYLGTDNFKTQYYFYKTPGDNAPVQLVVRYHLGGGLSSYNSNPAAYRGEKSRIHVEENKGYVNQLKFIMSDCPSISEAMWDLLNYRDYSFKNLIKKYNECD